jgi:hypothetical protein
MEARQSATPSSDPIAALLGPAIMQSFPAGGIDQSVSVGEKGVRAEQKQSFGGIPAGAVTLTRPDGSAVVLDPAAKTFWKMPSAADAGAMMQQLGMKPDFKVTKPGEFETIDGMRAERVNVTITMSMPGMDPAMASGLGQMGVGIDRWLTDAIKAPAGVTTMDDAMIAKLGVGDIKALKDLNDGRFMMKQVMKLFGIEVVTTVKNVAKAELADALFDVPKEFKETAPPGGGGAVVLAGRR